MNATRCLLACLAWLLAAGVYAQDDPPFDRQQALAVSQAVVGKTLGDHALRAADGSAVNLRSLFDRPLVVSLIYTSCYHICPTTTRNLALALASARDAVGAGKFRVVSIGIDPPADNPEAMAAFARDQGVAGDPDWLFLSADQATIDAITRELGFTYRRTPRGFDHLIQASVIAPGGRVSHQVYGMKFPLPQLVEPLKSLVFGTATPGGLFSALGNRIRLFCTVYDASSDRYHFDYSLFIGMAIGLFALGGAGAFLVREWRRSRRTT